MKQPPTPEHSQDPPPDEQTMGIQIGKYRPTRGDAKKLGLVPVALAMLGTNGITLAAAHEFFCAGPIATAEACATQKATCEANNGLLLGQICERDRADGSILPDAKCWGVDP